MKNLFVPAAALLSLAPFAAANLLVNGSLEGPTNTFSLVPPGWSNLAQGTTDTVSTAGHPFAAAFPASNIAAQPYPASANGGTFAWSGDFREPASSQPEGLSQTVTGLTVGAEYAVTFEYTNLGLYNAQGQISTNAFNLQSYNSNGRWLINADGTQVGATGTVNFFQTAGTQAWLGYSTTFLASATTLRFDFIADWVSGAGSHVGMGIDGITLTLVPAPSSVGVLALFGLAAARRRR